MEGSVTLTTLRMAISLRAVEPGLMHHSGRGSQYANTAKRTCSRPMASMLACRPKAIRGTTRPNESFMKTLKYEGLRSEYRDLVETHASIREFSSPAFAAPLVSRPNGSCDKLSGVHGQGSVGSWPQAG